MKFIFKYDIDGTYSIIQDHIVDNFGFLMMFADHFFGSLLREASSNIVNIDVRTYPFKGSKEIALRYTGINSYVIDINDLISIKYFKHLADTINYKHISFCDNIVNRLFDDSTKTEYGDIHIYIKVIDYEV